MLVMIRRRHQAFDIPADDLGCRVAEHHLGRWIEGKDAALIVDGDQAIGRCLDDRAQQRVTIGRGRVILV